ncbi:hypothetical protein [Pedobacter sp. JY14-1]|uniref:hypothetical protein n=1 Tax=Pedobacter sp. JY14-1 TaxID=3034151 RepID=UPI0023E2488A|nr:hypothetical protein [Pedobacter sp. JY14-1]
MRHQEVSGHVGLSVRVFRKSGGAGSVRKMVSAGTAYRNEGIAQRHGSGPASSLQRKVSTGSILFSSGRRRLRIHVLDVEGLKRDIRNVSRDGRQHALQVRGPKQRNWIIDIGIRASGSALISVWEFSPDGMLKHRFGWEGEADELQRVLLRCA